MIELHFGHKLFDGGRKKPSKRPISLGIGVVIFPRFGLKYNLLADVVICASLSEAVKAQDTRVGRE
jgi:hypothetical protein